MRIERLVLERFGHFADTAIALGDSAVRLTVLLGGNEAGKSTALRAIGDLLFGIDVRTPYGFQHGYEALRISAEIRAADGRSLAFRRRKGAKNTLLDMDDRPLPDTALEPFLRGADRALFDGLFGLDQQALREGGHDMLNAEGDLGQMLFDAGSHVRGLSTARKGLDEEADKLFRPNASKRAFNLALGAYQDARRQVEARALRAEDWQANSRALAEAEQAWAALQARRDRIAAERTRAGRIERLLPLVADLRRTEAELAGLAGVPDMPADAEARHNAATQRRAVAVDRARRAERDADAARADIEAIVVPATLLAHAPAIRRLAEMPGAAPNHAIDLPKRRAERAETAARLDDLARQLGLDLPAERLVAAVPTAAAMADLRARIADHAAIAEKLRGAAEQCQDAVAEAERAAAELAALPAPPDQAALRAALDAAKARGDLDERLADLEQALAAGRRALADRVAALPLWTGDAAALAKAAVPDGTTRTRLAGQLGDCAARLDRASYAMAQSESALAAIDQRLAALRREGSLPTADAVAAARARRDRGWTLIRSHYVEGEAVSDEDRAAFAGGDALAAAYERAVAEADALGDACLREAARIERDAQLQAGRAEARDRHATAAAEREVAMQAAAEAQTEWTAAWRPAGVAPLPPAEMEAWAAERTRILEDAARADALAQELAACASLHHRARAALGAALGDGPDDAGDHPLAVLVRRAEAALEAGARTSTEHAQLAARRKDRAAAAARSQDALRRAEAAQQEWQAGWSAALAQAGLPAGTSPAAAAAALDLWQEVRRAGDGLGQLGHRIAAMERDQADFAAAVRTVVAATAADLADEQPAPAAAALRARLADAEDQARRKGAAGERLETARAEAADAALERQAADAALALLRRQAGCAADDAVLPAIRAAARKLQIGRDIERLRGAIVQAADGLSLADAVAEADAADGEAVRAAVLRLDAENAALLDESRAIGERRQACRKEQADMEGGRGAADAAQDMADAEAVLADCARRWMVLRAAAMLLGQGIDRFRQSQQGPLVARAGALFRLLTGGSFAGFQIDYDDRDRPVLRGRRPDGAGVPVDGMSEGTRDQLFLALRLAAVERHAGTTEPLPFIADDLFVNFDEARAGAGLDALIALGAATQVILFTHHAHVADLAAARGGELVAVRRLGG